MIHMALCACCRIRQATVMRISPDDGLPDYVCGDCDPGPGCFARAEFYMNHGKRMERAICRVCGWTDSVGFPSVTMAMPSHLVRVRMQAHERGELFT